MNVYLITNTATGKYYVGQTVLEIQKRLRGHVREARTGTPYHLHNAIRKHGPESFIIELLAVANSKAALDRLERLFIVLLRASEPAFGYNLTLGGEGSHGYKHSEFSRRKMNKSHVGLRGYKQSKEHIEKRINKRRGVPLSEEQKKLLSVINTGKTQPPEQRERHRTFMLGFRHKEQSIQKMKQLATGRRIAVVGGVRKWVRNA
jgi:group I intron endonuclease